jgi:hypothetical protein
MPRGTGEVLASLSAVGWALASARRLRTGKARVENCMLAVFGCVMGEASRLWKIVV